MRTIFTGVTPRLLCSLFCAACALWPSVLRSQSPANCAVPPAGLVSWWRAENDASDAIGGNAGVLQPGVAFATGEAGSAFSFNGNTNSYIEVPDSPALRLTNEVTIEFWVKRLRLDYPSLPYAEYIVEKGGDWTGGQDNYSAALHNSTYNYCLHFVFAGGWRGGGSIADTNYWHHCAIVARNGDADPTLYVDGVMQPVVYREGASTINLYPSTRPLHIGAQLDPATGWFYFSDTLVDELAIYGRALSATEIQSIYAAGSLGKCVPGSPPACVPPPFGLTSWWRAEGNGNDSVGTNNARLSGGVSFTTGVVGQAFLFNGVDGSVVADDAPSLNIGSNQNFSIEVWISPLPSTTDFGIMSVVDKRYAPTLTTSQGYEFNLSDGRIHCRLSDSISGNGAEFGPAGPDLRDGNFHHVALSVVRGSSTGGNLFVDGQVVLNFDPTSVVGDLSNAQPFRIGNHASSFVNAFFKGRIDEVSVYARALGSNEVLAIYNAGAAGKCTSTQAPAIVSQPQDQVVNAGQDAIFTVQAQGSAPLNYQWFFGATRLDSPAGAMLVVSNAQPAQAGNYHVVVSNSVGFAVSSNALLAVLTFAPMIDFQPYGWTVPAGGSAAFYVQAHGSPPLSYQWYFAGRPIVGATDFQYALGNIQPSQAGPYYVVITNAYGSVTSSNAILTVLTYPPAISSQPRGTNAYVGSTVTFQVVATGSPVLSYQWQKEGAPLPGATGSIYRIFNAQLTNAGTYSVIVTNPYGALPSSNAVLTVRVPPPCTPPPPGLVSWWRGENNLLDGWDANNGNPSTQPVVRYAAGKVGQCFSFSSFLVPDSPSLHVSNITLQAWVNAPSYAGSLSHTIVSKVDYLPTGVAAPQSSFYLGTTNNGLVYFAVSPNGSNTVSITTAVPLAPNDWSFVVAAYDGSALRLYTNGMLAAIKPYSGGIFQGTDNLGIGAIPYPYSNSAIYAPFNGLLDEICLYNRARSDAEVLALYNSDVSGMCQEPPVVVAQPQSQEIPLGEDVLFSASVLGTRPLSYQWYFNSQVLARATNANLLLEKVRTNQAGTYFVRVTNSLGSASSDSATLKLIPAPVCTPAPPGLLAWWPADGSPIDVVSSNNAVLSGLDLPPYATGKVGQCFNLASQRSPYPNRISVPNSSLLNFRSNADLSIEGWVKYIPLSLVERPVYPPYPPFPATPGNVEIVRKYAAQVFPATAQTGYALSLYQGRLAFWLGYSPVSPPRVTNSATFISSGPDLGDGMFHHVAVTLVRNAINGGKLYVDGQNVLTFDTTRFPLGVSTLAPLSIGSDGAFNGLIDELTFYSRALSADEVLAIRQAGAAGKCKVGPFIITQPANQTAPPGSNATFTITADGTPNLRYQWRFNGAPLFGATSSSLTITNVQSSRTGKYSVTITNGFGLVLSTNAVLAFNGPPVAVCATAVVSAGPNCLAAASIDNGSADADGDPVTLTQTPPGPYPLGTNVVTLTATDKWGVTNSCTALVIVLDRTPPTIICPADIVVTNAHNALTTVVTFGPAVSDNCSGVGLPICSPASGSAFGVGPHTVTCSVTDAAGNSNQCAFKVTVLPGNVPPVPIIRVSPLAEFPSVTNLLVIAGNGTNATVVVDGSKSYDLDDTNFNYFWYEGTNLFSTDVVAARVLALGLHRITLRLDDTFPLGTSSASVTVEVISAEQAVELLIGMVDDSTLPSRTKQPLLKSLEEAEKHLDRGDLRPAREVLVAFEHKVRELVTRIDLPLAKELQTAARQIVDALDRVGQHGGPKGPAPAVTHQPDGKMRMRFAGESGRVQIIEASSDLLHWQKVGVATEVGNGWFEFEDAKAATLPYRYYRVVSP